MNNFLKYSSDGSVTEFVFVPSGILPSGIPISTPLTFSFAGQNLLLVKKHNDWWDILGGKVENDETYIETIKREAMEEAGVSVSHINLVGYILATNNNGIKNKFPYQTILPITTSFIVKVHDMVLPNKEIKSRDLVKRSQVGEYLCNRLDNNQLLEIYNYVISYLDAQDHKYEFEYVTKKLGLYSQLPVTQATVFIKNSKDNFYLVREKGSDRYLLPGGGCHLYESGEECAKREVYEEIKINLKHLKLLGIVVVRLKDRDVTISESLQMRYFSNDDMGIEPSINMGDEIEEIIDVKLDQLMGLTEHLKNPNAHFILDSLKKTL